MLVPPPIFSAGGGRLPDHHVPSIGVSARRGLIIAHRDHPALMRINVGMRAAA